MSLSRPHHPDLLPQGERVQFSGNRRHSERSAKRGCEESAFDYVAEKQIPHFVRNDTPARLNSYPRGTARTFLGTPDVRVKSNENKRPFRRNSCDFELLLPGESADNSLKTRFGVHGALCGQVFCLTCPGLRGIILLKRHSESCFKHWFKCAAHDQCLCVYLI